MTSPQEDAPKPSVSYDIAMEILKNSTLQMFLKVDHSFSEQ